MFGLLYERSKPLASTNPIYISKNSSLYTQRSYKFIDPKFQSVIDANLGYVIVESKCILLYLSKVGSPTEPNNQLQYLRLA